MSGHDLADCVVMTSALQRLKKLSKTGLHASSQRLGTGPWQYSMFEPQQLAAMGCISSIMPLHAPAACRRRSASADSSAPAPAPAPVDADGDGTATASAGSRSAAAAQAAIPAGKVEEEKGALPCCR